jgi:hypothetical protein
MRLPHFARHHPAAASPHEDQQQQPPAHDIHSLHAHHYFRRRPAAAVGAAAGGRLADAGGGAAATLSPPPNLLPAGHPSRHPDALTAYEGVLAALIVLHAVAFALFFWKLYKWSTQGPDEQGARKKIGGGGSSLGGVGGGRAPSFVRTDGRDGRSGHHNPGPAARRVGSGGGAGSVREALKQYVKVGMGKH